MTTILTKDKFYIVRPAAATNLITNPSFELATTGWTAVGAGVSIARSGTYQRRGAWSGEITTATNVASGAYASVSMVAPATYYFSVDVKGTASQAMRIYIADTGGNAQATTTFTANGYWQRVNVSWQCNSSATYRLYVIRDAVASTAKYYIDGAQCEATQLTTYLDGDMTGYELGRVDYRWTGSPHASTSTRTARTRTGGVLVDLSTYCTITGHVGLGMPSPEIHSQPISADGSVYQGTRLLDREFMINVLFIGSTGDIYANRKYILDIVKPDAAPGRQQLLIRYQGQTDAGLDAGEPVDIPCAYAGGLELSGTEPRMEKAVIRFIKHSPLLEMGAMAGVNLTSSTSVSNFANIGYRDTDGTWKAMGTGANALVNCMIMGLDGSIYAGGNFTSMGGVANTGHIAKWNGTAWVEVGGGLNDYVFALAVGPDGSIYAGGNFTNAGGVAAADYIAKWDGSSWSALGSGTGGPIYAITVDKRGYVFAGGNFTNLTDASGDYISMWNGAAWASLGTGMQGGYVYALDTSLDGTLYAGGAFTTAGGVTGTAKIAKWNGSAWLPLSTGMNDTVKVIKIGPFGGVFAGGLFTTSGGVTTNYIARWNGTAWEAMAGGVNGRVDTIDITDNAEVYAGGIFTSITGYPPDYALPDRMAIFKNNSWRPMDVNVGDVSAAIYSILTTTDGRVYIGGGWTGTTATSATVTAQTLSGGVVYPRFLFTGPGSCWQIKNYTNGNVIYFNALTLLAGETAVLDTNPLHWSFTSSFRGNMASYILPGSTGFRLEPGDNNLSAYMTAKTAASGLVATWKPTYTGIEDAAR